MQPLFQWKSHSYFQIMSILSSSPIVEVLLYKEILCLVFSLRQEICGHSSGFLRVSALIPRNRRSISLRYYRRSSVWRICSRWPKVSSPLSGWRRWRRRSGTSQCSPGLREKRLYVTARPPICSHPETTGKYWERDHLFRYISIPGAISSF